MIGKGLVGGLPPAPSVSVHAVEVEVDRETGKGKILDYAVAQDLGLALNPLSIEGQIQGAAAQGMGWALMEGYQFEKGRVLNPNFLDYRLPTAVDAPSIHPILLEIPSSSGIYGIRQVGEPPIVGSLAAIANAVHDAVGVRVKTLPLTPEVIWKTLKCPIS